MKFLLILPFIGLFLGGYAGPAITASSASGNTLQLEKFFSGEIDAWGIIQDRGGNVLSKFHVDIVGTWQDGTGTLDEHFEYYESEKKQRRVWKIRKLENGNYVGSANDILGEAVGKTVGDAVFWTYKMMIPYKGKDFKVKFDDWIWPLGADAVMNRSEIKKFGFKVGEVTIFMKKRES